MVLCLCTPSFPGSFKIVVEYRGPIPFTRSPCESPFEGVLLNPIPCRYQPIVTPLGNLSSNFPVSSNNYYTYPTSEIPTIENIKRILAFPNASPIYKTAGVGALVCGDEVKLKYWNVLYHAALLLTNTRLTSVSLVIGISDIISPLKNSG